jgi:imidazolonepropionase-like amidohydrolase
MYAVDGVFRAKRPPVVDRVVDLAGGFVVPPFGEAHNHLLFPDVRVASAKFLQDGVYYVRDQGNLPYLVDQFAGKVNLAGTIDMVSAHQPFTGPGGHPLQILEYGLKQGLLPAAWTADSLEGNGVFQVEDPRGVERAWQRLLARKPDFVKVMLLYSEEYERRRHDPSFRYRRGIDPRLVPLIVQHAHDAGLRVSAHVYTGADFSNALRAGVHEIAHLPGGGYENGMSLDRFRISEADARLARKRKVVVITTVTWLSQRMKADAALGTKLREEVVIPNLKLLKSRGVRIVVGSDLYMSTPLPEVLLLAELGVFTNAELLRMWCVDTPQMIFPHRKLGRLEEGYEASFLVLRDNPLYDFTSVGRIALRFKQGHFLP